MSQAKAGDFVEAIMYLARESQLYLVSMKAIQKEGARSELKDC